MSEENVTTRTHVVGSPQDREHAMPIEDDDSLSVLEALEASLSTKVERDLLKLTVPARPNITMVFDTNIDYDLYQAWIKKGNKGNKKNDPVGMDHMMIAVLAISHTNVGIEFNGKPALRDGNPLTIRNSSIHKMLKVADGATRMAITMLYGKEGHAIQTMNQILEKAGYSLDGDVEQADPLEI